MFDIEENLKNLPDRPGVYLHKDKNGEILYVGKALSLKKRVRQYFRSNQKQDPKVKAMVSHIAEFEYIITETEMEALLLESSLVKRHMPKYNVLLRDDKTFPFIKVTLQEEWPRLIKTRKVKEDGARYFGPYTDAAAVNELIELLSAIYQLKRCSTLVFPPGWKPCLNYHLGLCRGVCTRPEDAQAYRNDIEKVIAFLSGETNGVEEELRRRMEDAAAAMDFELAALYRDRIATVKGIPDQKRLDGFLKDVSRNKVKIVRRKAEAMAQKEEDRRRELENAWIKVGFSHIPRTEAYDISHIAGNDAVGGMVVFENGKPLKKEYRRFRIRIALGGDDSDSLKEVIHRRMKRGLAADPGFSTLPDLLLVDGGQQQVAAARRILGNLGLEIPAAGVVKDEKHRTRGFLYNGEEVARGENPVLLRHLATVQEEVHRYAIEYLRGIRSKQMKRSALDEVPGIGEKRKQALFERFGSIEAMRDAEPEELSAVPGMNRKVTEILKKHLNNKIVNPRE